MVYKNSIAKRRKRRKNGRFPSIIPLIILLASIFITTQSSPAPTVLAAPGDNLALAGTASQSSTGSGGDPDRAIDGNTSGEWGDDSVTHTNNESEPWWQVDLGSSKPIDNIIIWNRTDCCGDRIDGAYLLVSDTPFSSNSFATSQAQADFELEITSANRPNPSLNVPVNITGRYVRIHHAGSANVVSLAEVQVFEDTPPPPDTISGNVFRDYNANGTRQAGELGIEGIRVTATDADGHIGTATTDANGDYTIDTTAFPDLDGDVRVEFTLPTDNSLDFLEPGVVGGTTVQFANISTGAVLNASFQYPADYCQANPDLCTPPYAPGDPLATPGDVGTSPMLISFPYSNPSVTANTTLALGSEIGATWGLAWQRSTKQIYSSAFLKRHVGLGPDGLGAIYVTDLSGGASPTTTFVKVGDIGINPGTIGSNTARLLPAYQAGANVDASTVDLIGKIGLGDIDISDDDSTLWLVNLNDQTLYSIVIDSVATAPTLGDGSGNVTGFPIPAPVNPAKPTEPACTGGEWRPFALKSYQGNIYVGGVCDAQTSQDTDDLIATIYRFDGSTFTNILTFPLDYEKGLPSSRCPGLNQWYPWTNTVINNCDADADAYPQPILSDIEFDVDGSMIIGFVDRFGHQAGWSQLFPDGTNGGDPKGERAATGGDILRAHNNNGTFILESNGTAGSITTVGAGNGQGPENGSGTGGEYYYQENYGGRNHDETAAGGLALKPGTGEVATTAMDITAYGQSGVLWMENTTGAQSRGGHLVTTLLGKAHGLGDLEVLCDAAPIEIGNRVWEDTDGDGVQDPDEAPLANVLIGLYDDTDTLIATVETDSNGNYLFSSDSNGIDSNVNGTTAYPEFDYDLNLLTNSNYTVGLLDSNFASGGALENLQITRTNGDTSSNGDTRDSDLAALTTVGSGGDVSSQGITVATGGAGNNNHTFDMGFTPPNSLGNRIWFDNNNNGTDDGGDANGPTGVLLNLLYSDGTPVLNNDGTPRTATTDSDGYYLFDNIPAGDFVVEVAASNFDNPGDPLYGYGNTTNNDETDPESSGDSDDNGLEDIAKNLATDGLRSGVVSIRNNGEPTADDDTGGLGTGSVDDDNSNLTVDFSFFPAVSVGNRVWFDTDGNSTMDGGESGIAGVTVQLFIDSDGDGIPEPGSADDTFVAEVTTDSSGYYQFTNLQPGLNYFVAVVVDGTIIGSGGTYARSSSGGNQNPDSEGDEAAANGDDGIPQGGYVVSQVFTPTVNGQSDTTDDNDVTGYSDDSSYVTVDFGFTNDPTAVSLQNVQANAENLPILPIVIMMVLTLIGMAVLFLRRQYR